MTAPHHEDPKPVDPSTRRVDAFATKLAPKAGMAMFAGLMLTLLCTLGNERWHDRLEASYLAAFAFFLSITLGALFFVVLQHLVKAGWSVTVRRVAEGIAANILLCALLFVPVALLAPKLYPWTRWAEAHEAHEGGGHEGGHEEGTPEAHEGRGGRHAQRTVSRSSPNGVTADAELVHEPPAASKAWYLSLPQFLIRFGVYFAIWIVTSMYFGSRSRAQDATGDLAITKRMEWMSAPAMIAYALTTALAGFDLLMSMDPSWYSTMFGVYWFAGCVVSAMATLTLTLWGLQRSGLIRTEVTPEHYHDVGKLMFAFIVFWAYVAYSQFMLIWYGNIPEEVAWFMRRTTGGWFGMALWLVVGHFVIPFFGLLSRFPKRHPNLLAAGALWVLFVHYADLLWIVLPQPPEFLASLGREARDRPPVPLLDLGLFLALGGLYAWNTARNLSGASLIPERDPRLAVSLRHENY